jgi:peptide deformylase
MIYDLVDGNSVILKQQCVNFNFSDPPVDPKQLAENLKESMIHHRGIGLSACQVGLPWCVFAVGDPRDPDNITVMFNPKIVHYSDECVLIEEGCLSYPGLFIKIKRSNSIRIRFSDADNEIHTRVYDGIPARAIQHEYDHLNGITYQQRCNSFYLDQAKRQKKKLDKKRKSNYNDAK